MQVSQWIALKGNSGKQGKLHTFKLLPLRHKEAQVQVNYQESLAEGCS